MDERSIAMGSLCSFGRLSRRLPKEASGGGCTAAQTGRGETGEARFAGDLGIQCRAARD